MLKLHFPAHPPLWPYPGTSGARSYSLPIIMVGFGLMFFGLSYVLLPWIGAVLFPIFALPFHILTQLADLDAENSEVALLGAWWSFWGLLVVSAVIAWTMIAERRSLASIGVPKGLVWSQWWAGFALGGGIAIAYWVVPAMVWFDSDAQRELGGILSGLGNISGQAWIGLALFGVGVVALAFMEEILFRGWMLSAMSKRIGVGPAVLLSSAIFSLYHFQYYTGGFALTAATLLNIFVMGLLFAALALAHRSLLAATALHAAHNIVLFLFCTILRQTGDPELSVKEALWLESGVQGYEQLTDVSVGSVHVVQMVLVAGLLAVVMFRKRSALRTIANPEPT